MSSFRSVAHCLRRTLPLLALAAAALLIAACSGGWRASFPTEDEVRRKLQRGMTAEQVKEVFGDPPGIHWVDPQRGGKVPYIAPIGARTRPVEGYAGFTVYYVAGKVWDWEVVLLNPSYEHRLLPLGANSWQVRVIAFVVLAVAAFFIIRRTRSSRRRRKAMLHAYETREIPAELPPEFRFVTPDTTVQMVVEKAGPYSRIRTERLNSLGGGEQKIVGYEYDLPSGAAVIVLPENPRQPESRIRGVVYRPPPEA